jgi:hypothetical protein
MYSYINNNNNNNNTFWATFLVYITAAPTGRQYLSPTVALLNTPAFLASGDSVLEMSLVCTLSSLQLHGIG